MDVIAHYNLLERIGRGGLGDTYRARDTRVGRTVALKLVSSDVAPDAYSRSRLLEEAQVAAQLSHPNVSTLFDTGETDGQVYLAYEYAPGRPLREEMAGAAMNLRRALEVAVQLSDAVADAHAHGIIHGDLRPDTIIITPKGSAKILDFGFARWTRGGLLRTQAARSPDRLPPDTVKVLAYLSPEQALGGAIDSRTDVFSLGVVFYEMLTGRSAFAAATASDTVVNVIQGPVPAPTEISPGFPPEVERILSHALARDLSQRQQSAALLASELRSALAAMEPRTTERITDETTLLPLDERPDKSPAAGLLLGALGVAAVAAAAVWWWLSR